MPKRPQPRPRAIPAQHETWAEREAAAARSDVRYVADLDGEAPNMHWVIKVRETGEIVERCPTLTKSEVEDRAAQRNGLAPLASNKSWGKLTKGRAPIKSNDSARLTATEWVERLVSGVVPETVAALNEHRASGRSLTRDRLLHLLALVAEPHRHIDDDELLEAISQQLYRNFGIRRSRS